MKLYTIEIENKQKIAIGSKNKIFTIIELGLDESEIKDMNDLILGWGKYESLISDGIKTVSEKNESWLSGKKYKILAPVQVPLQDIVCLGVNYYEHALESVEVIDFTQKKDAIYFSKRVNHCSATGDSIPDYDFVDSLDYEVELGVVLKKDAFKVSEEDARNYILGYTIINDVSARNLQFKHNQWYFGKSLDGYTPMGPCIVTLDEIGNPANLTLKCFVNNEKRQESNTRLMITTVEQAIAELSQGMTLKAGTIIASGTPGGVALGMKPQVFLKSGDVVRCKIEKIGVLENQVE